MIGNLMDNPAYMRIAMAAAGLPVEQAAQAAADLLAQCIGLMTDDLPSAEATARKTGEQIAQTISINWLELCLARQLQTAQAEGCA